MSITVDTILGRVRKRDLLQERGVWYVSPTGTGIAPGTAAAPAAFTAALTAAADGRPITIRMAAGDYTIPGALSGADIAFVGTGGGTSLRANGTFFTNCRVRLTALSIVFVTAFSACELSIYACTGSGVTVRGGRAQMASTTFVGTTSIQSGATVSIYGGSIATLTVSDASRAYVSAGATITNPSPAFNVEGNQHSMIVYGGAE